MSFHLRIFNLREDVTNQDIRRLFSGMSIQKDGVVIIGGSEGEAFVTFDLESDLLLAMRMDGEQNLKLKIASDVDKLKGINIMCMAKLQKLKEADSSFLTTGYPKVDHHDYNIQIEKTQHQNDGPGRFSEAAVSDSSYATKRRRIDSDMGYVRHRPDEFASGRFSRSHSPPVQQPWKPTNEQRIHPKFAPNTTAIDTQTSNKFHKAPSYKANSVPIQVSSRHVKQDPSYIKPGFQSRRNFSPGPDSLQSRRSNPEPHTAVFQGSLLLSLLSKSGLARFCNKVSELPPDVTPSMVWSWDGGTSGTALGVVLLKSTNDEPAAFLIYANCVDRDETFQRSGMNLTRFSADDTCHFIKRFVYNWKKWKGTERLDSPIFETTFAGKDRYVNHKTFFDFAMVVSKQAPVVRNRQFNQAKQKVEIPNEIAIEPCTKQFLVVYQLDPSITATEVFSWVSDGVSALMLNFHEKDGPKNSEAMAFILFDSEEAYDCGELELREQNLVTAQHTFRGAYNMISKYGEKCTVTETTPDGDRVITPEERKEPPFQKHSSAHGFTLVNGVDMRYLHLKGIPSMSMPIDVEDWYPTASGIVVMTKLRTFDMPGETEALVAFETQDDLNSALKMNRKLNWKFQNELKCQDAMYLLSRTGYELLIATTVKLSYRRITAEEAKFIISQKALRETFKAKAMSTKSQNPSVEETSFIHHLKNQDESMGDMTVCLSLCNLKKELTACQIHNFFPDAVCALHVSFNGDALGPKESKAIGYLLLSNTELCGAARLLFEQHSEDWRDTMSAVNPYKFTPFQNFKVREVEEILARISCKSTICESSPSGVDRMISPEELSLAAINPPFSLVHEPPCMHFALLTAYDKNISATEIWSMFGWRNAYVKGVVLLIAKMDLVGCMAYLAFSSSEERNKTVDSDDKDRIQHWPSIVKMSEQQTLGFLRGSSDDYIIKISTEAGCDRNLEPDEEKLLGFQMKVKIDDLLDKQKSLNKPTGSDDMSVIDKATGEQSDCQSDKAKKCKDRSNTMPSVCKPAEGIVPKSVEKIKNPSKMINDGFYIRLKRVPAHITTACKVFSLFGAEGLLGETATLVRDCDGIGVSAYVMFDELEHRESALSKHQFSVRCTPCGRAIRLAELEADYEVLESTESGQDRVLSMDERNLL